MSAQHHHRALSLAVAVWLFRSGMNTALIAAKYGVPESLVYNLLASRSPRS